MVKVSISKSASGEGIRDHSFFLEYLKLFGMLLFAISMTTPVLGLVIFDVDLEILKGEASLDDQLIWDKPILPYIAGFLILMIHWFKFVEVNASLKDTNLNHILINFGFFFVLCLYPYFEMNIEFTSDQANSRAVFTAAWGLLGIFSYWQLHYAQKHNLIKESLTIGRIRAIKREILADPIVAAICIGLAYVDFITWLVGMVVLVPLVNFIMGRISFKQGH